MTFNNSGTDHQPERWDPYDPDPPTQVFPDFADPEMHHPIEQDVAPAATGLARWFDLRTLSTEIVLTAVIVGVVALFGTAVADTALGRVSGNYEPLGWAFSAASAGLVFVGTMLAAGVFLLLFAGTKSPQRLYSLLFWAVIPALIALIMLASFSIVAVPYVLVVLIWAIPVTFIPARSDQHRID